ncbi:hypothetical protein V2J09_019387 [Rumex salicifolius]
MAGDKYNLKNPAVKRILQEVKEMQSNPSDDFMSLPLEENIFEWQFAIRGPGDSEFEGGIYHGRIQLPAEYPFKPPSFMLLTLNGRFETQTKICLSISNHHPEHWQPSWSVRTALVALIAFMPTSPNGALGSLDYPKDERRVLAVKSREGPPKFGTPERQNLIDEIHEYMLSKAPPVPEIVQQGQEDHQEGENVMESSQDKIPTVTTSGPSTAGMESDDRIAQLSDEPVNTPSPPNINREVQQSPVENLHRQLPQPRATRSQRQADDRLFTLAVVGLTLAIAFLILKKFMKASGYSAVFMNES